MLRFINGWKLIDRLYRRGREGVRYVFGSLNAISSVKFDERSLLDRNVEKR